MHVPKTATPYVRERLLSESASQLADSMHPKLSTLREPDCPPILTATLPLLGSLRVPQYPLEL